MKINTISLKQTICLATLALVLLLSACTTPSEISTQAPVATQPAPTQAAPTQPAPTRAAPTQAIAPTQALAENEGGSPAVVTLDLGDVAQAVTSTVVAGVPSTTGGPWWAAMPQHTLLDLQGYPVADHSIAPQIFVYRVADLGSIEVAGDLQTLLQTQQAGEKMPYLPLYNASQVMHAQVAYLDFKDGKGVRFLTAYNQAPVSINDELIYTYQGLTSDGQYYLAVVLPVSLPGLPTLVYADSQEEFADNYHTYLNAAIEMLSQQPASAFTPDLGALDALVQSIEVK